MSVSMCFLFLLVETLVAGGDLLSRFDKGGEGQLALSCSPSDGITCSWAPEVTACFDAVCDTMSQLCGVMAEAVVNDRSDEVLLSES